MKSNRNILLLGILSIVLLNIFSSISGVKIQRKKQDNNNSTNITMITPIIDENHKMKEIEGNFQKVEYVKELTPAGKKAIEIADLGE